MVEDKTSYGQSLTHMIKGNLGAGVLGMGSSFAHLGLVGALISLPALCLICGYCVHLLIKSARAIERQAGQGDVEYPNLARRAMQFGPKWARHMSEPLGLVVDVALLLTQVGVCCVYTVFVVDNVVSILASYNVIVTKSLVFVAIFPLTLLLTLIRTLKRLAVASLVANLLQFIGLALIFEYLSRDLSKMDLSQRDQFRPINEMALGFGSTMFAFEGISVVLPIYSRMKQPKLMASTCGIINISYLVIVTLYFVMGILSYLRYGQQVRDSITLNLPAEPLYDAVRAMFTASILLTFPLQFYVPNEMIWNWVRKSLLSGPPTANMTLRNNLNGQSNKTATDKTVLQEEGKIFKSRPSDVTTITRLDATSLKQAQANGESILNEFISINNTKNEEPMKATKDINVDKLIKTSKKNMSIEHVDHYGRFRSIENLVTSDTLNIVASSSGERSDCDSSLSLETTSKQQKQQQQHITISDTQMLRYEYYCRVSIVVLIFTLAVSVPKLNLLMDLIGSFSGAALCLTIPALIHMTVYWDHTRGFSKCLMIILDTLIIVFSLTAGLGGSLSSMSSIINGH